MAFNTFEAVYTEKYQDEAPSLMKCCSIIKELAFQSANWKFYDENFRLLRQKEPWPWHQIHSELYPRAHLNKNNSNPSNQGTPIHNAKRTGPPFQRGFVGNFTMVSVVPGAPLKHRCYKCDNAHPISRCQQNLKPEFFKQAGGRVAIAKQ